MPFRELVLDFTKGLDSDANVGEVQFSIDPVTHYTRVLCTMRVVTILFTVHLAR